MPRRKLDIDGKIWRYQVGSRYIKIRGPDGKAYYVNKDKLAWEDNPIKQPNLYGEMLEPYVGLTPSAIKKYIEVVLIKKQKWFPHRHLTSKLVREYKYSSGPNAVEFAAAQSSGRNKF